MSRLTGTPAEIERCLASLADTPRRIAQIAQGLPRAALHTASGPKAWSPADVLAHLRACADLWTHSMYAMLAEREPELPDLDERRWARTVGYAALDFARSLHLFTLQREELLQVLGGLSDGDWSRRATIAGRGHTVYSQARRMAKHESEHCAQLEALAASYPIHQEGPRD